MANKKNTNANGNRNVNKNAGVQKNEKAPAKRNILPVFAIAAAVVCLIVVFVVNRQGVSDETAENPQTHVISQGESLVIPVSEITEEAVFYPIEVDGVSMEVFAVKASDGTIRTAFNTCQSCYTSGAGFYTMQEGELVCNNCGFHFSPDQVEVNSGGCNPWPIFSGDKAVTEDSISISYDFLSRSKEIFAVWKKAV